MDLPEKAIGPTRTTPKVLLVYGPPKIGKTTILSGLKNNLIIDLENGTDYVEALKVKISNLNQLSQVGAKIKEKNCPYNFVTIDTVTRLEDWCERNATEKYKRSFQGKTFKGQSVLELDYGLGYGLLRAEYKSWLERIKTLSDHIILIGHVKDKIINKDKTEVFVKDINLTGQIKAITASDADAVGYIYLDPDDTKRRIITFFTSDEIICGSRCKDIEGKSFVISEKDDSGEVITSWDNIYPNQQ